MNYAAISSEYAAEIVKLIPTLKDEFHVVIDKDLVTCRSAADIESYCHAIIEVYRNITENPIK